MPSELLTKLKYKASDKALILNIPKGMEFSGLDFNIRADSGRYSFILLFAKDKAELDSKVPSLTKLASADTIFWIAYPKAKDTATISRDKGWGVLNTVGYRAVSQVAIDENWSALRIKPTSSVRSSPNAKTQTFEATIETNSSSGGAWVSIPFDIEKVFGTRGQVKVKATFDGHPYRGSIANMGTGSHILIVKKEIRAAIGKESGDTITVEIQNDTSERIVTVPKELEELLGSNDDLKLFYEGLSFTNRKEYANWISSAKRVETKEKRLKETKRRLSERIKNPFIN